jgi:L-alanine-DL-glutamate epimerase-like enolase superfamily enzyme
VTSLADDPLPTLVVVETVAEALKLDASTQRLKVVLRDHETLVAVWKRIPDLTDLHLDHPGNRMPIESIRLLREFKKLKRLEFRGDPFLSDEKFVELGKLEQIKSLRLRLL